MEGDLCYVCMCVRIDPKTGCQVVQDLYFYISVFCQTVFHHSFMEGDLRAYVCVCVRIDPKTGCQVVQDRSCTCVLTAPLLLVGSSMPPSHWSRIFAPKRSCDASRKAGGGWGRGEGSLALALALAQLPLQQIYFGLN